MKSQEYLLGADSEELKRLDHQHELWRSHTMQLLRRARFERGHTLLDAGCGPGSATLDLGEIVGAEGRVIGVDSSPRMIECLTARIARRGVSNLTALQRNVEALNGIGRIDGAFARWVFSFLPHPDRAVQEIAEILRPGGRLAVMDYFNYLAITMEPDSAVFRKVGRAVFESIESAGGDPEIGRKLPRIMGSAGLSVQSIEPICAVGCPGSGIWEWFARFQRTYFPKLVEKGFLGQADLDTFDQYWADCSRRTDAFLFAPPMLGIVGIKT